MRLIQELYSDNGYFKKKVIENVLDLKKVTAVLPQTIYTEHIKINSNYFIIFRDGDLRNEAYKKIIKCSNEEEVVLTLDEFYPTILTVSQIRHMLEKKGMNQTKNINFNVKRLIERYKMSSVKQLTELDCFNNTSLRRLRDLQRGKQLTDEEIANFSKALIFPKEYHNLFGPTDFWCALREL